MNPKPSLSLVEIAEPEMISLRAHQRICDVKDRRIALLEQQLADRIVRF